MWPRFAPRLLTLLALMMNARERKRCAVAEVRQLADALGSPVPRSKTDLTVAEFAALHREVKGHCLTPEQHAALDRAEVAVVLLFVIGWIPVINLIAPLLWLLFSAWMMAVTYLDYPMDNNKVPFADMRRRLAARRWPTLTYGGWVMLITWVPLANLFLLPGAVAGAVLMWEDHYRVLAPDAAPARR